jgi:hypothetical protein
MMRKYSFVSKLQILTNNPQQHSPQKPHFAPNQLALAPQEVYSEEMTNGVMNAKDHDCIYRLKFRTHTSTVP